TTFSRDWSSDVCSSDLQPDVNLKGKFLPRAPQLSLAYGIAQTIPTSIGYFDWSLSGQTKSKMYMTQFNGEGFDINGNVNPLFSRSEERRVGKGTGSRSW